MEWNPQLQTSQPRLFQECTRDNCPTCHIRLPTIRATNQKEDEHEPEQKMAAISTPTSRRAQGQEESLLSSPQGQEDGVEHPQHAAEETTLLDYDIHDSIQIVSGEAEGRFLDLKQYTNQCIPNLPSDLMCPVCRCTSQRTLLLSEFSYRGDPATSGPDELSPLGYRSCTVLTLTPAAASTPCADAPQDEAKAKPATVDRGEDVACKKRPRIEPLEEVFGDKTSSLASSLFPPRPYQDLAIPIQNDANETTDAAVVPLQPKPYIKHGISIHCVQCQKFAVLAPAGLCWSSRFPCLTRFKKLDNQFAATKDKQQRQQAYHVGGMLVRTACSEPNCVRPVFCHDCSHATFHAPYPFENNRATTSAAAAAAPSRQQEAQGNNDPVQQHTTPTPMRGRMIQLQHSSRCDSCKLDYCPAHAWLSTVCHHW
jgi:hypothetical protein